MLLPNSPETIQLNTEALKGRPSNQIDVTPTHINDPQSMFDEIVLADSNFQVNITEGGIRKLGKKLSRVENEK